MTRHPPAFPPDVAAALQRPAGRVSVRYTRPASPSWPPPFDVVLMRTPYERVLVAVTLDTKRNLRFVRTGSAEEGARRALVDVGALLDSGARHWDIELAWDAGALAIRVSEHAVGGAAGF